MSAAFKALASKDEYQVAFISPLPIERAAATALLDERHAEPLDFSQHSIDENAYTWGRIHEHNVVITSLPAGMYGVVSATTTVLGLLASLPSIKIGLLVGIGAAIPESGVDIRLGDIAVARPEGISGGVVQYDTGKTTSGKGWERTGMLAAPSKVLLNALAKLQAEHEIDDSQVVDILEEAGKRNAKFAEGYKHPGIKKDRLYEDAKPEYEADDKGSAAESLVVRPERPSTAPNIYYGIIASGNMLVRDAGTRRAIIASVGQPCICLEMEAAGLMNNFPCLVIRGICDYADAHKDDTWQRYACATAAAFAKELLLHIRKSEVQKATRIEETFEQLKTIQSNVSEIKTIVEQTQQDNANNKVSNFLRALYTCPYAERKDRNISRVGGTCDWFTKHDLYARWLEDISPNLLWVSADPGCGKSVLAKYLVDEALTGPNTLVCYFFFKEDYPDQRSSARAASAFLRQLLTANPELLHQGLLDKYAADGDKYIESFTELWATFIGLSQQSSFDRVICVLDALDECQHSDRHQLVESLCNIFASDASNTKVRILATSRPYTDIKDDMLRQRQTFPIIHLSGDNDAERNQIGQEIKIVINQRISDFVAVRGLSEEDKVFLVNHFMGQPERTYLWINLFLKSLEDEPSFARGQVSRVSQNIPTDINQAYNKILNRSPDQAKTKLILQIIMAAKRPLLLEEMAILLCLDGRQRSWQDLEHDLANEVDIMDIIKHHCSLIVNVANSKIYIHHQTARTFLAMPDDGDDRASVNTQVTHASTSTASFNTGQPDWRRSMKREEANRQLAIRCLWFIMLSAPAAKSKPDLYNYCACTWSTHFRLSDIKEPRIIDLAVKLCDSDAPYLQHWFPFLLNSRPGIRAVSKTPITLLSILDQYSILESILSRNKKMASQKRLLSEALWWTASDGYTEVCRLLLKNGADPNTTASGVPYDPGKKRLKNMLSSEKATTQFDTMTCLHDAIRYKNDDIVDLLLEYGADVNAQDCLHYTSLFPAVDRVRSHIVPRLLQHKIDPAHKDIYGATALSHMFRRWSGYHHDGQNCISIFEQLIEYQPNFWDLVDQASRQVVTSCFICANHLLRYAIGASKTKDKPNTTGKTLLHLAIYLGNVTVVRELLMAESKSRHDEEFKISKLLIWALSLPTRKCDPEIISLLISNGADGGYLDSTGRTYLHHFMISQTLFEPEQLRSVFEKLRVISPYVDSQDNNGYTPLMLGILAGPEDSLIAPRVQLLLDSGADYTETNSQGVTANSLALQRQWWQTERILEDWALKELLR